MFIILIGIDLMVFNTLKERWVESNHGKGNGSKTPDVMTLVYISIYFFYYLF